MYVAKRAGSNSKELKLELFHDFGAHQKKPAEKRAHTEVVGPEETSEVVGKINVAAEEVAKSTGNAVKSQADAGMEPEKKRTKPAENVEEFLTSDQPQIVAAMAGQPAGEKNQDEEDKGKEKVDEPETDQGKAEEPQKPVGKNDDPKKKATEGDRVKFIPTHEQAQKIVVIVVPLEELFSGKLVTFSFGPASER